MKNGTHKIKVPKKVKPVNNSHKSSEKENNSIFWDKVHKQERQYGSIDTPEYYWGPDVGTEVIK